MYQLKKINKKDLKLHSKPWVNPKIQRLIKYRDELLRKLSRNFSYNTEYLYKTFRNRIVNELRSSKINYYNQYFTDNKSDMKKLWSGIKSIINIKNNRLDTISQIVHNGQVINKPTEMANVFNHYIVNIAFKIDDGISRTRKSPLEYLGRKSESSSFFLSPTDTTELNAL